MDASKLLERIDESLKENNWRAAMAHLSDAWLDEVELGWRPCTRPEYQECWVRFKDKGYPFSLRHQLDTAKLNDVEVLEIILPFIVDWKLVDLDGGDLSFSVEPGASKAR